MKEKIQALNKHNLIIDLQVINKFSGGGLTYIRGMLSSILKNIKDVNIFLIINESSKDLIDIDYNKVDIITPPFDTVKPLKRLLVSLYLNRYLEKRFTANAIYWLPFNTGIYSKFKKIKTLVTIHDLLAFQYPDCVPLLNRIIRRIGVSYSIKCSDAIITISNFTRQQIFLLFRKHIKSKIIRTIYEGVYTLSDEKIQMNPIFDKKDKFMLVVSIGRKNKNFKTLINSFSKYKKEHSYRGKLYIIGSIDKKLKKTIDYLIRKNEIEKSVVLLGFIKDEELPMFYQKADLFLFPSYYEGFGLPVIEASYYGCKVVASNATAVEEVSRDFAFQANPFNVNDFVQAMHTAMNSDIALKVDTNKYNWNVAGKNFLELCAELMST